MKLFFGKSRETCSYNFAIINGFKRRLKGMRFPWQASKMEPAYFAALLLQMKKNGIFLKVLLARETRKALQILIFVMQVTLLLLAVFLVLF